MMNKILLVTGASSDIGTALIRKVHVNYGAIFAHYTNSVDRVSILRNEIGDKVIPIQADFSNEESTALFSKTIIEGNAIPSHFVHLSASLLRNEKFHKTKWAYFEHELSVSFRSGVIISQTILPYMAKTKYGKIIFMLSYNTINQPPVKYSTTYTCTKYALLGLMKTLSAEYADKGIMINGVSPSMIETRFLSSVPELIIQKNAANSPLKRNLAVDDVIPTFEYLLSAASDAITGQNIAITGGN